MIAYKSDALDNVQICRQADEALAENCITKEENTHVKKVHSPGLYMPNIYIRIGLFLLTFVIVLFTLGLLLLMLLSSSGERWEPLLIVLGFLSYGMLEFMVNRKKHFRSGVDDALLLMSVSLLFWGVGFSTGYEYALLHSFVLFVLAGWGLLRFTDRLMTLLAYSALVGIVFNIARDLGPIARPLLPFLQMAVAAVVYLLFTPLLGRERFRHYRPCLVVLKVICLIGFYGAGNYFIVREAGVAFLGLPRAETLPIGWLFWTWTIVTPLAYIYWGIRKKDPIFLWMGLALVAAMVLTIRNYYHVLPAEVAMVIGGVVLVGASYALMRYLRTPRYGFCNVATTGSQVTEIIHIETLVIAETFAPAPHAGNDFRFGGGTGSGGGAGGEF